MAKDIDAFIKELEQERFNNITCPPSDEMWGEIIIRLRKEKKKKLFKRLRPVFAASIVIVLLTISFIHFQIPVKAFTNKIIKTIQEITESTFKIHMKVVSNEDEKDNDIFFGRNIDDPRIGEAQEKIHFKMIIPEYIPENFKLSNVDVINKYEKKETVTFLYINSDNDKQCFEITQRSIPHNSEVTLNIGKDENTKIEHLSINETECTLVSYDKNLNGLLWNNDNISYELSGNISREDIIKIAESMK